MDTQPEQELQAPPDRVEDAVLFWAVALLGTLAGAGLFGLILGGPFGAVFGPIFGAVVGVPVQVSMAIVAWAFWLSRFRLVFAALGGATTGLVCTVLVYQDFFALSYEALLVLAAILGGAGAGVAAFLFLRNTDTGRRLAADSAARSRRFTLREMFLHLAVLTLVISCWASAIAAVRYSREQSRLRLVELREKWIEDTIARIKDGGQTVSLYSCSNTDLLLERIAGMPGVRGITFEQTNDLTDKGLNVLPSFGNLVRVAFYGERALDDRTIAVLSRCRSLESVTIGSSSVTDAGLSTLGGMPQLREFQHTGQFSEAALKTLQQKLPDCVISKIEWYD